MDQVLFDEEFDTEVQRKRTTSVSKMDRKDSAAPDEEEEEEKPPMVNGLAGERQGCNYPAGVPDLVVCLLNLCFTLSRSGLWNTKQQGPHFHSVLFPEKHSRISISSRKVSIKAKQVQSKDLPASQDLGVTTSSQGSLHVLTDPSFIMAGVGGY